MRKKGTLVSCGYKEATISIPYIRLRKILEKGDIIDGHFACNTSAWYVGYRITHIAWWGVYAVPTDEMLAHYSEDFRKKIKKHYKFKWENITGVKFCI